LATADESRTNNPATEWADSHLSGKRGECWSVESVRTKSTAILPMLIDQGTRDKFSLANKRQRYSDRALNAGLLSVQAVNR